jgi:hypothetical protein
VHDVYKVYFYENIYFLLLRRLKFRNSMTETTFKGHNSGTTNTSEPKIELGLGFMVNKVKAKIEEVMIFCSRIKLDTVFILGYVSC